MAQEEKKGANVISELAEAIMIMLSFFTRNAIVKALEQAPFTTPCFFLIGFYVWNCTFFLDGLGVVSGDLKKNT